jgi:two-component system, sensor histidine kinase and response regulator
MVETRRIGYGPRVKAAGATTILVVDDNPENRALARATLEDEGYRVVLATGGAEAVDATAAEQPDCILMDIRMPRVDGIEACGRIRLLPKGDEIAIVFLTAQRDVATFDRAVAAGGDDFITKPFRPDELLVRVQTALRLRRLAAERGELVEQLKQQRDRLQRLELQKEQLVAFLVHDLKNPVNAIELQAELVSRHASDGQRARAGAAKIKDETRALMRLITNLLDISKADEGALAPAVQTLNASELVRGVAADLDARATAAGIRIETSIGVAELRADADLIARVLANLIDNAIHHSPEGAVIGVAVTRASEGIELRVTDAGPGVPSDQRELVFERFRSGSAAARTNRGLGLAFCKIAVEAHGGRIWVESGSPGATFCVRLPDVER